MSPRRSMLMHAWLQVGLVVAIAVVANHVASTVFFRADVTRDQRFTLSQVSRDAVDGLDKPLVVRVFYSEGLGPPYNNHKLALLDKLEELRAWSGGRLEIEVADPDGDPADRDEARRYGLDAIPYRFKEDGRFEARDVHMGVALLYGDRVMPVDALSAVETFEYQLVRGIRALTTDRQDRTTIGYTVGQGELDLLEFPPENPVGKLVGDLAVQSDLRAVTLGGDDDIDPDIDVLLVNGPEQPLTPRAQYQIDQFIMSGRPVAFFLRGFRPDFRSGRAVHVRHDLYALLGHYGVRVNRDAIVDREHNEQFEVPLVKNGRMRRVMVDYPLIPVTSRLSDNHPVTAGLEGAVLPFVSSIEASEELPAGIEQTVLVTTEDGAGRIEGLIYVGPDVFKVRAPGEEEGSFPVMLALSGRFGSFYAEKTIPPPDGRDPLDPSWQPDPASKIVDSAPTRILVAGSADMLANNQALVLNAIDWLVEDTDLMEIRTELAATATFEPPDASTALGIKAAVAFGPLVLLYLVGGGVLLLARRRR